MRINKTLFTIIGLVCIGFYCILTKLGVGFVDAISRAISSSFILYFIVWFVFDRWVWKMEVVKKMTGVHDFNGVWKGELYSSYGEGIKKDTSVEILQTFSKVVIKNTTNEIKSTSFLSIWERDMSNKEKEIFYMYRTDPKNEFKDKNPIQYGSARVRYDETESNKLRIEYWTDRKTTGHMLLTKVGKNE